MHGEIDENFHMYYLMLMTTYYSCNKYCDLIGHLYRGLYIEDIATFITLVNIFHQKLCDTNVAGLGEIYGGREGHYPWYTSTPTREHLSRRTFSDA